MACHRNHLTSCPYVWARGRVAGEQGACAAALEAAGGRTRYVHVGIEEEGGRGSRAQWRERAGGEQRVCCHHDLHRPPLLRQRGVRRPRSGRQRWRRRGSQATAARSEQQLREVKTSEREGGSREEEDEREKGPFAWMRRGRPAREPRGSTDLASSYGPAFWAFFRSKPTTPLNQTREKIVLGQLALLGAAGPCKPNIPLIITGQREQWMSASRQREQNSLYHRTELPLKKA